MHAQQADVAYNLGKAEEYRKKAEAATDAGMQAAFRAIVREYLARARALDLGPSRRPEPK
jgi:hypothetical protein